MGDDEYEVADAGASEGTPILCGAIKKGCHVIMKGKPCKIIDVSTSKTGKHGSAKVNYCGYDIFTNKRLEECHPSSFTVYQPNVVRTECPLVSIEDGYVELLLDDNSTRSDIKAGDLAGELEAKLQNLKDNEELLVTFISAMGEDKVTENRVSTIK